MTYKLYDYIKHDFKQNDLFKKNIRFDNSKPATNNHNGTFFYTNIIQLFFVNLKIRIT